MIDSLLKKFLVVSFFAFLGFFASHQTAMAQATHLTCESSCINENGNALPGDLQCCGAPCPTNVDDPAGIFAYCAERCACGNGRMDTVCDVTEECDDGNTNDGDGCSEVCMNEAPTRDNCGDGILDEYCGDAEECDDGNNRNGDGCDSNCTREPPPADSDAPSVPTVTYRGIATNDFFALRETMNKDLNIRPQDFVVPAVRGVTFAPSTPGTVELVPTVMPKLTAALNLVLRTLFPGFTPPTTTVPTSLNIGCVYPRDFCFTVSNPGGTTSTTCAKGCRETKPSAWSTGATACPNNIGCCTNSTIGCLLPRAALPDDPETPENDPITADSIRANGVY